MNWVGVWCRSNWQASSGVTMAHNGCTSGRGGAWLLTFPPPTRGHMSPLQCTVLYSAVQCCTLLYSAALYTAGVYALQVSAPLQCTPLGKYHLGNKLLTVPVCSVCEGQ